MMKLDLQTLRDLKPRRVTLEYTTVRDVFFISVVDKEGNELLFTREEISLSKSDFDQMMKEFDVDEAFIQ